MLSTLVITSDLGFIRLVLVGETGFWITQVFPLGLDWFLSRPMRGHFNIDSKAIGDVFVMTRTGNPKGPESVDYLRSKK